MPYTSVFIVIANIDVMIAESTGLAQVENPMASTSAEDSAFHTLAGELSIVEFVAVPVASKATTITVPEMSATILVSTEPSASLVSVHSELAPAM